MCYAGNSFRNLTSFQLVNVSYVRDDGVRRDGQPSVHDILAILQASQSLESLIFRSCRYGSHDSAPLPDFITSPTTYLTLPALRRVLFDACYGAFAALILHRLLPSRTPVLISFLNPSDLRRSFPQSAVSGLLRPLSDLGATTYAFSFTTSTIHILHPALALSLCFWSQMSSRTSDTLVPELLHTHPFLALRTLRLSGSSRTSLNVPLWARLFGTLTSLSSLTIQFGFSADQDTAWLKALGLGGPAYAGASFPAPALRKLTCLVDEKNSADDLDRLKELGAQMCAMLQTRARGPGQKRLAILRVVCRYAQARRRPLIPPVVSEGEKGWRVQVRQMDEWVGKAQVEMVERFPEVQVPDFCREWPEFEEGVGFDLDEIANTFCPNEYYNCALGNSRWHGTLEAVTILRRRRALRSLALTTIDKDWPTDKWCW